MRKKVLVINYHEIDTGNEIFSLGGNSLFSVSRLSFEEQISILLKQKIPVVSLDDIINNRISSYFSVAITIDDGNNTDYEVIYPFLKLHNIKATFFWLVNNKSNSFNHDQAIDMVKNGFTLGSHGIMHQDMTKLSVSAQKHELEFSKYYIEEMLNQPVEYFSLPFGMYNRKTIELAKTAGYKALMTTDVKLNYPDEKSILIHRWSIKRSTTLKQFEGMVTNKSILKRMCITSEIRKSGKKILGKSFSDKINILLHSSELTEKQKI